MPLLSLFLFFSFTHPAPTEIYTLSLHDALPILAAGLIHGLFRTMSSRLATWAGEPTGHRDRKSTRLNSSHVAISYAVFCLKKKKNKQKVSTRSKLAATPTTQMH